jgi:hypothetical protein
MMKDPPGKRSGSRGWLLLFLIPSAFFLKDIIATVALLSTEPGITKRAALYFHLALLPGTLFVNAGGATAVNLVIGVALGGLLYLALRFWRRRPTKACSGRATQRLS